MKKWEIYKNKSSLIDGEFLKIVDVMTNDSQDFEYKLRILKNGEIVESSLSGEDLYEAVSNQEIIKASEVDKAKILLSYKEF